MLPKHGWYHFTTPRKSFGGDEWIRATDLLRMKEMHYRCATSPKFGAPWQNRTAVTWLQNRCNAIILIGQMLSLRRGNYSTSVYFWFVYIAPVSPSSMPSTHSPRTELSCCQRWLGRPHGWTHVLPLQQKNHPTDRQSVSLVRITLAVISCRFGCRGWIRTNDFMAYETRRIDHFHTLR